MQTFAGIIFSYYCCLMGIEGQRTGIRNADTLLLLWIISGLLLLTQFSYLLLHTCSCGQLTWKKSEISDSLQFWAGSLQ